MGIISGIIGGAAGIGQSIINARTQNRNVDATNEANRKMAEYAYSKDLEMWNRNNEYNSPEKQMERLSSAGLNPNLVYGHGAVGNTSGQLPKYNAPTQNFNYSPPLDVATSIGMYQDYQVKQAQIDNLKQQRDILEAEGYSKRADMIWKDQEMKRMFYKASDGKFYVKPELEDTFNEIMAAKWTKPVYNLSKTQADIRGVNLANELKQKEINWFIADRLGNMAVKTLGAFGLSKVGRKFTGNVAKGRNHDIPPIIPQRRIITYYK